MIETLEVGCGWSGGLCLLHFDAARIGPPAAAVIIGRPIADPTWQSWASAGPVASPGTAPATSTDLSNSGRNQPKVTSRLISAGELGRGLKVLGGAGMLYIWRNAASRSPRATQRRS